MKKILVKYCGGCNPRYDRSKIVQDLEKRYPSIRFISSSYEDKSWDFVLVLSGCTSSCTDYKGLKGKHGKMILKNRDDYRALINRLDEIMGMNR